MGDERRRILLTGEPRGHKEDKAMDREKMLDVTLQQIEKQFGKGAVMKLGEHPMGAGITVIPSGSLALDIALGVGGIPRGRIIEVFGPEGSGKTTVCLHMIAEAQAKGGIAAFIDAEHALDPTYARELGVEHRRAAGLPAGLRRAGARDRRHARAVGGARHRGRRLGGRARAPGRDRGRDGRHARRPAGAPDVPGHAEARRDPRRGSTRRRSSSTSSGRRSASCSARPRPRREAAR